MIELFGDVTGNCIRAAIALEESGLPHRLRKVDLKTGEQRGADYLQLNPVGRVPAIVDDDGPGGGRFVLTQSNAILMYVSERSGRLLPKNDAGRASAFEWLFLFVTDVIAPNHQAFHLTRALGADRAPAVADELNRRALGMYALVDNRLGKYEFLAGESLSIADIAGYTITAALTNHLVWEQLPHVQRWFANLAGRRGFQRGMTAFR